MQQIQENNHNVDDAMHHGKAMGKRKVRLDHMLVARGAAETRAKAQALLMAGAVRVNGQVQTKPGLMVAEHAEIVVSSSLPYVSRGGQKLAHALDTFGLSPASRLALDVGASTGGFTDVLLQRGARLVYAVDVGYGQLDWRIRNDERVVVLERTNIRTLQQLPPAPRHHHPPFSTPIQAEAITIDVSFISLRLVFPAIRRLMAPEAWIVALVKPQFEAGRDAVGKGGVVRDPHIHRQVLHQVIAAAEAYGLFAHGITRSPLMGPAGNKEFLLWFQATAGPTLDIETVLVDR